MKFEQSKVETLVFTLGSRVGPRVITKSILLRTPTEIWTRKLLQSKSCLKGLKLQHNEFWSWFTYINVNNNLEIVILIQKTGFFCSVTWISCFSMKGICPLEVLRELLIVVIYMHTRASKWKIIKYLFYFYNIMSTWLSNQTIHR